MNTHRAGPCRPAGRKSPADQDQKTPTRPTNPTDQQHRETPGTFANNARDFCTTCESTGFVFFALFFASKKDNGEDTHEHPYLLCLALLGFAVLGFAELCFALLSFAELSFA